MSENVVEKSLAMMQLLYPNFTDGKMKVYFKMLEIYPDVVVGKAIGELIRTNKSEFAPSIGSICSLCEEIIDHASGKAWVAGADAWGEVRHVVTKIGPYEVKSYKWKDKTAEEVARAIGLDALFSMQSGTEEDVIRGQFLKMYEGKTNHSIKQERIGMLLADGKVKEITEKISEKMQITGGN